MYPATHTGELPDGCHPTNQPTTPSSQPASQPSGNQQRVQTIMIITTTTNPIHWDPIPCCSPSSNRPKLQQQQQQNTKINKIHKKISSPTKPKPAVVCVKFWDPRERNGRRTGLRLYKQLGETRTHTKLWQWSRFMGLLPKHMQNIIKNSALRPYLKLMHT